VSGKKGVERSVGEEWCREVLGKSGVEKSWRKRGEEKCWRSGVEKCWGRAV